MGTKLTIFSDTVFLYTEVLILVDTGDNADCGCDTV